MQVEGKKNLSFLKRALLSHMVIISQKSLSADDKTATEQWDPELAEINKWLDAVEKNLEPFVKEDLESNHDFSYPIVLAGE
jgi:hypothetical protein